jgi:hypothetical protein
MTDDNKDEIILNHLMNESYESSPERKLYLAVIFQALLDLTKPQYTGEPTTAIEAREDAVGWFMTSIGVTADDFQEVCDLAGIDASYTRGFARLVLSSEDNRYVRRRINTVF